MLLLQALDVFLAGDDVSEKKPNPKIYVVAAEKLGVDPSECLVVEDSSIGLQVLYYMLPKLS
jgi:HAD superfamily hydrolase (TIGR01509 family)